MSLSSIDPTLQAFFHLYFLSFSCIYTSFPFFLPSSPSSLPFHAFLSPFLHIFPSPSFPAILSSIPSFSSIYASFFHDFLFILSFPSSLIFFLSTLSFLSSFPSSLPYGLPSILSFIPYVSCNPSSFLSFHSFFPLFLDLLLHGPFTKPILRWLRHSSFRK